VKENEDMKTVKEKTDSGLNDNRIQGVAGQSLLNLVKNVKADYDVKHMLVWHTLTGYWGGVQVDDKEGYKEGNNNSQQSTMSNYLPSVTYADMTRTMHRMSVAQTLDLEPFHSLGIGLIDPAKIGLFYKDYHKNLREMGVDGVKVDAQALIASLKGSKGGGYELASNYHTALKSSIGDIFGNKREEDGGRTVVVETKESRANIELNVEGAGNVMTGVEKKNESENENDVEVPMEYPVIHCMGHSQGVLLSLAALYDSLDSTLDLDISYDAHSSMIHKNTHTRTRTHIQQSNERARRAPVIRGSDDFWPLDDASHGPHLYVNAFNSLLLSHIAVQDWDMFQSSLGRTSRMHACARAVSGGPVYVSDKPTEHDGDIINHLAYPDGSLPRCLRNARPPSRSLFLDPQKQSNTPLLLQNINPSGGMVIAAFHVLGAVLENDKDLFRLLRPSEITWDTPALQELARDYSAKSSGKTVVPVHEIDEFKDAISIDCNVCAMDVEEADRGVQKGCRTGDYVAHRLSDGQLFDCITVSSDVPVVLKTVYDYDVISFAEKHYFAKSAIARESGIEEVGESRGSVVESDERSQSVTVEGVQEERSGTWTKGSKAEPREGREQLVEDKDKQGRREQDIRGSKGDNTQKDNDLLSRSYEDKWIAVIGARNKYNPGGSVLSVSLKGSELQLDLLGCGDYMMVTNDPLLHSYATVLSSLPLGEEDGKGHKKYSISTNLSSSSAGTSQPDCSNSTPSNTVGSNTNSSLYVLNLNVKLISLRTDVPHSVDDVVQNMKYTSPSASTSTSTCASESGSARDEGDQGAIVTINFF
jgi:Raffinose synthase or seed imbibition protein Sip1